MSIGTVIIFFIFHMRKLSDTRTRKIIPLHFSFIDLKTKIEHEFIYLVMHKNYFNLI